MKSIDFFCASPASTAICSGTVDRRAIVLRHKTSSSSNTSSTTPRCLSRLPVDPSKPFADRRKSTSSDNYNSANNNRRRSDHYHQLRRKSSADVDDWSASRHLLSGEGNERRDSYYLDLVYDDSSKRDNIQVSWKQPTKDYKYHHYKRIESSVPSSDGLIRSLKSSSSSTKSYESPVYDAIVLRRNEKPLESLSDHLNVQESVSSPAIPDHDSNHKVVELRVSIHCKGCEGKLRKHISRMQGVTSFSIDLATKKVRIVGNLMPLEVLASISKVKNAQFWPSPTSSSFI